MLNQQTIDRLAEMKLRSMISAYQRQREDPSVLDLSFEERFGLIVDSEWIARKNRYLQRLLKESKMPIPACIEDIDYTAKRKLDRKLITRLSTGEWVQQHQNLLIFGPTGVGKSFLACAMGNLICRLGYAVRYYRVSKLLEELQAARGDGTYFKKFNMLKKVPLLILDDWGLKAFSTNDCSLLFELFEERNQKGSTLIAGQIPIEYWNKVLLDPTITDAILDRIIHNAYRLNVDGCTMRMVLSTIPKDEGTQD